MRFLILGAAFVALAGCANNEQGGPALAAKAAAGTWTATWGTALTGAQSRPEFQNVTLRQTLHISEGGERFRIRISNELGKEPLRIDAAAVARPEMVERGTALAGAIDPATGVPVAFDGQPQVTIAPGTSAVSDPVAFPTSALGDISVNLLLASGPVARHPYGLAVSWSVPGNHISDEKLSSATEATSWSLISAVEVETKAPHTIVAIGDSTTDGVGSTINANRRWPDYLAARVAEAHLPYAVVNTGVGANLLLGRGGVAERFDRDVLSVTGVSTVIVLAGINDFGFPGVTRRPETLPKAETIIAGLQGLIARAHAKGVRIIGGTITPYAGTKLQGYYSPEGDAQRKLVNTWIRESHAFDGVVDFEAAVRDPSNPDRYAPDLHAGDFLHPNDAGYRRMADAINLALLR